MCMPSIQRIWGRTSSKLILEVADKGIVPLSTELSREVVQVKSPDEGSSKMVVLQVTDL